VATHLEFSFCDKNYPAIVIQGSNIYKKNLKIPKGQSEFVYGRRADSTLAKRKSTKG
jgi:hypothetical protein